MKVKVVLVFVESSCKHICRAFCFSTKKMESQLYLVFRRTTSLEKYVIPLFASHSSDCLDLVDLLVHIRWF